jgi:hypothetical protein
MPPSHWFLLRELCLHWHRIQQHAESANKMTAHNLAICLAPTLKIPVGLLSRLINV